MSHGDRWVGARLFAHGVVAVFACDCGASWEIVTLCSQEAAKDIVKMKEG